MKSEERFSLIMSVLFGLFLGAAILWGFQQAWQYAAERDANPRTDDVKSQVMRRKSMAMAELLDEAIDGNLTAVGATAKRMEKYGSTIEGYLMTDIYVKYGEEYAQSLQELQRAVRSNDQGMAKEAILRLERSCIECHQLINTEQPLSDPMADGEQLSSHVQPSDE